MTKLSITFVFAAILLMPLRASAQSLSHAQLWCQLGGQKVTLQGLPSTTEVQRSIPSCTVHVYLTGTVTSATVFSDNLSTPTPKANPFTALSNGTIDFYAATACYDIVTSGGTGSDTFPAPYTYTNLCLGGAGGGGSGSVTSVGFAAPSGFTVSGSPISGIGTLAFSMPPSWTSQDLLIGAGANAVSRLGIGANGTCLTVVAGALAYGAAPCVGIPAGTTNQLVKRTDGPNSILGDSSLFDDGTNPVQTPNGLSVMSSGTTRILTNATPATTVLNQLVERNSSGLAINATSGTSRALGIAGQGAGIDGTGVQVVYGGYGACVFDNQTIINDFVTPSSTTPGLCHDAGATRPLTAEVIGTVTSINTGAATTAVVDFFTGDTSQTTPSAVTPCGSSPGPLAYYTAASVLSCDTAMSTDGAGNGSAQSWTMSGASAGFIFLSASTQPTFAAANSVYVFAPTSIPTTYALKMPSALGTAGQALVITGVSAGVGTLGFSSASGCPEGTCLQNAPAADQTVTGAHGLVFSNASAFLTVPTLNASTINLSTPFTIASSAGIILSPTAANTVLLNNTGLSIAGTKTTTCASCSLELAGPAQFNGSTSGSIQVTATAISGSNVITLPALTGTAAVIVGGVLTTTNLTVSGISGSVQCLHVNSSGVVSGTAGDCATGGSGTVTSIATTSPITGGTITTTGTIACATCVVASSPGVGIAHFAGATQTVTSSLIVNADITASTIDLTTKVTGILPSANGGTANAFFTVAGPSASAKTYTFPNASAGVLTDNAAVTVAQGGTGLASGTSGGIPGYTGSTTITSSAALTANSPVLGGGAGATPKVVAGITSDGTSVLTLGVAGTSVGGIDFKNATSGTISLRPVTGALGTVTLSLPAATDTLIGKATTDTLTNKTYDTAGTGNSFSINGVAATANTGTGSIARAASPTFTGTVGAAAITATGAVSVGTFTYASQCISSASPAVCGSSSYGMIAMPTGASGEQLVVNTTAVTANSVIQLTLDRTIGGLLGITCNINDDTTLQSVPVIFARTVGTSFSIHWTTAISTNKACMTFSIIG